ncbi:Ig-like domain-containing protein, partial [Bacteroidales bacterium OttesenSCG-928-I14]|nr:Ig-like domain-containing protein [Bacteroidales bacterium OttesenSCG-928-I14]
ALGYSYFFLAIPGRTTGVFEYLTIEYEIPTPTLTINRAALPAEAPSTNPIIDASTGEPIEIRAMQFNYAQTEYVEIKTSMQSNGIFNLSAIPGAITKISMKLPEGVDSSITWSPHVSGNFIAIPAGAALHLDPKTLNAENNILEWEVDPALGYSYFFLAIPGRTTGVFEYLTIEYEHRPPVVVSPEIGEASELECNSFVANWSVVNNALSYSLYVQQNGENIEGSPFTVDTNSYLVEGLSPETTYTYYVEAVNGDDVSEPSETMTVITPICPETYVVTLNNRGDITTLEGLTVNLPTVSLNYDCIVEGWTFAGWSLKSTEITEADIIAAGEYTPAQDITLYSVFTKTEDAEVIYDTNPVCESAGGMTIPYYQNFDEATLPNLPLGWIANDVNADGNMWRTIDGLGSAGNVAYSMPYFMGVGLAQDVLTTSGIDDWAFTPMFYMEAGQSYKVSFYIRITSFYATYKFKLALGEGQTISDMSNEPLIQKDITGNADYNYIEHIFTVETSGNYSLGFHCSVDGDVYSMGIDDFAIESAIPSVLIDEVFPLDNSVDIPAKTEVYAVFNQDITDKIKDLSLINIPGASNVSATLVDGNKLLISHDPFAFDTNITVNIPEGAIDGFGEYSWDFTTVNSEVIMYEYTPLNYAQGVWTDASIAIRFNKEITIADSSKITIDNGATGVVPRVEGSYLYIDHDAFERDKTYTITIAQGAIAGWIGTTWKFSVVKSGSIIQETALYGPVKNMINVRHVSDNGRYVVGKSSAYGAFMWDLLEGNDFIYPLRTKLAGEAYKSSNDGLVVGLFDEEVVNNGAYWYEGKSYSMNDTINYSAVTITPDGKKIGGFSSIPNPVVGATPLSFVIPTTWNVKDDKSLEKEIWAYPEDVHHVIISDISADGKIAVGRASLNRFQAVYVPIYWTSKDKYTLMYGDQDIPGNFTCISANGKYAGFRVNQVPGILNIETGEIKMLSGAEIINAISNDGLAVGMAGILREDAKPIVYSEELGYLDFADYVKTYLTYLDKPVFNKLIEIAEGNTSLMHISSDGKNWAIQYEESGSQVAYMLHLEEEISVLPRPTELIASVNRDTRNVVELSWKAPVTSEEVMTYDIYADSEYRGSVDGNELTFTDEDAPVGYLNYTVTAIYDSGDSPKSDPALAVIVDNYNIPFKEDFASGSINTNFWQADGWHSDVYVGAGVERTLGLQLTVFPDAGEFEGTLTSKPFDATNASKVYLSYLMMAYYNGYGLPEFTDDMFYVEVTTDGVNWTKVDSYQPERLNDWRGEMIDISDKVAGRLFNFRFRVEGENNLENDAKAWLFDYIRVETEEPNGNTIPGDLIYAISEDENSLHLAWQDPSKLFGLTHAKSSAVTAFGNEGANMIAVHAFNKEDLSIYNGLSIQSISVTIGNKRVASSTAEFKTAVFINGERVDSSLVSSYEPGTMNTFILDKPILITSDINDLKIGIEVVRHHANEWPLAADNYYNVVKGKGDLYSEDGGSTWKKLSDINLGYEYLTQCNWSIIANLSKTTNNNARTKYIVGYNVYKDGVKINTDMKYQSHFTTAFEEGIYTLRAFSLETEELSSESKGVNVSLNSIETIDNGNDIKLFPNPASLYVNIEGEYIKAFIYDINGRLIIQAENESMIPVSHLPAGIYAVNIHTDKGISSHKLIIK